MRHSHMKEYNMKKSMIKETGASPSKKGGGGWGRIELEDDG